MLKVGQTIVYRHAVCKITDLIAQYRSDGDYFTLVPLQDETLVIHVPVASAIELCRPVISRREVERLMTSLPDIEKIAVNERVLESAYKELLNSDKHEDLLRIIKTAYLRNDDISANVVKRGEKDKMYFRMAETMLYSEFASALGKSFEDTKVYVAGKIDALRTVVS